MGAIPIIQNIAIQNQSSAIVELSIKEEIGAVILICFIAFLVGILIKLSNY